jgi:surfeit locus 1 family protein
VIFRPFPILTLLSIPSLIILIWLGTWQVQRMEWKRSIIAQIETGLAAPAVPMVEALEAAKRGENVTYRKVIVDPLAGSPPQLEWASQKRVFRFGLSGERLVLVETAIGEPKPDAVMDAPKGPIEAVLRPAARANAYTPDNDPSTGFWYWLDAKAMAAAISSPAWRAANGARAVETGYYAAALTLCDYSKAGDGLTCVPTANPRANPKADTLSPERHLGYVITWWGLAVALVAVYLALHARAGRLSFR